jgi:hypothetical protein
LISIHSAEDNKFTIDLANRDRPIRFSVWIGAKRNNSLDYFEWTNGQEFNYSNRARGQPKHSTDPESHVTINSDGTWSTWHGSRFGSLFVCESDSSNECLIKHKFILSKNFLTVV